MKKAIQQFVRNLVPFIGIGIFFVLLLAGLIIFSWLLILGAGAGLALFVIYWIYSKLTTRKYHPVSRCAGEPRKGRIIDHDK